MLGGIGLGGGPELSLFCGIGLGSCAGLFGCFEFRSSLGIGSRLGFRFRLRPCVFLCFRECSGGGGAGICGSPEFGLFGSVGFRSDSELGLFRRICLGSRPRHFGSFESCLGGGGGSRLLFFFGFCDSGGGRPSFFCGLGLGGGAEFRFLGGFRFSSFPESDFLGRFRLGGGSGQLCGGGYFGSFESRLCFGAGSRCFLRFCMISRGCSDSGFLGGFGLGGGAELRFLGGSRFGGGAEL